jgi:hypothetical protein
MSHREDLRRLGEDLRSFGKKLKTWFSVLFGLGIILYFGGAFVIVIYQVIDATGNIPHTETTDITVSSNWLMGETKQCSSPVLRDGSQPSKPHGYAMGVLSATTHRSKRLRSRSTAGKSSRSTQMLNGAALENPQPSLASRQGVPANRGGNQRLGGLFNHLIGA